MNVSKLIEQLQEILDTQGDLPVYKSYADEVGWTKDEIDSVSAFKDFDGVDKVVL